MTARPVARTCSCFVGSKNSQETRGSLRKPGILVDRISVCAVSTRPPASALRITIVRALGPFRLCVPRTGRRQGSAGSSTALAKRCQMPLSMGRSSSLLIRLAKSKTKLPGPKVKSGQATWFCHDAAVGFARRWPRRVESLCMG